jgi:hypothetical protein
MNGRSILASVLLGLVAFSPVYANPSGGAPAQPAAANPATWAPEIDAGFRQMYELHFPDARESFHQYKNAHAGDPLSEVSIASSYLFEELYHQGVLSSEFFLDNKRLLGGIQGKPDEERKTAFLEANRKAQELASERLKANANDADALFVMAMAAGMQADYLGILERRQMDSLHQIRQAEGYAKRLLEIRPEAADGLLALGTANYIIGSLSGGKRFFLSFAGVHGDKKLGLQQLGTVAEKGHYLRPYAKLMLALAFLREKMTDKAGTLLAELSAEFPANPLFARELDRLHLQPALSAAAY